jgi:hypothetical protein
MPPYPAPSHSVSPSGISPTRAPAAPPIPERAIQASMMTYLRLRGYYVLRLNAGALPNAQGRPVHMLPAGCPDLLAIKAGRATFIEVKRPGKMPTERQRLMMETLRLYGARCICATSVEELERELPQ